MRNMKIVSEIPRAPACDCPEIFRWFFSGAWNPLYLTIQDGMHMVVKAFRALMSKNLQVGMGFGNKAILVSLTKTTPKMLLGINTAELVDDKDRMNYGIAERVCSRKVIDRLTNPDELPTKSFLKFMRHIITAYISSTATPEERIYSSWFLAFYCRIWKEFFSAIAQVDNLVIKGKDALNPTVERNFISSNLHSCIEINGHSLLLYHNKCRDLEMPELFLPSKTGSQQCESEFRTYRSMSTTRSTVVDFDIKELLQKAKRLSALKEISTSSNDFVFAQKRDKEIFIPKTLCGDDEIDKIIQQGFADARTEFASFGKVSFKNSFYYD